MLGEVSYPESGVYRTGNSYEPINFFMDALSNSNQFDMLLGYFSTSAIKILSVGFAKFIINGGRARFIINNILSENDKQLLITTKDKEDEFISTPLLSYQAIKNGLTADGEHFFNCLAWLIAHKRVEIVVIRPKNNRGIAHYKSGTFSDGTNTIGFKGSCNFTAKGLIDNLEEVMIFRSWLGIEQFNLSIEDQRETFNKIFNGVSSDVEYLDAHAIEAAIQSDFGNKDIDELLADEKKLIHSYNNKLNNNFRLQKSIDIISEQIIEYISRPKFPNNSTPRPYQIDAYQAWLSNGRSGIFAMATGTGKTITALNCLLEESKNNKNIYKALILVPTLDLASQWESEVYRFNFKQLIKVNSKTDWYSDLSNLTIRNRLEPNNSFIIICSYSSFVKPKFQKFFVGLPSDTIIIADEAHTIGAGSIMRNLANTHLTRRIGLSATPTRAYDDDGTKKIELFFRDTFPYTFNFSIKRAIDEGFLCKYQYYPHIVPLEEEELGAYVNISKDLMKYFDFEKMTYKNNDIVKILLLKRKRIIQKAINKIKVTYNILKDHFNFKGNLQYSFVYVPEGGLTDIMAEQSSPEEQDFTLLDKYKAEIQRISPTIHVESFTSQTSDRSTVLKKFQEGSTDVLVAMKCLDEGVDVPRAELAIFCASTGNPRQFIQRRGRVLRQHSDKHLAVIHDLVVVPYDITSNSIKDEQRFNMERNLVKKELERVAEFAFLSINEYYTHEVLEGVCDYYNLSLHEIYESLKK